MSQTGRVVVNFGAESIVADASDALYRCVTRRRTGRAVCGDRVEWRLHTPREGLIERILPRDNTLVRTDYRHRERPLAANLDRLVAVCAAQPEPDIRLLDRYLVLAHSLGVEPVLVINKSDLGAPVPEHTLIGPRATGCAVHTVSANSGAGLEALRAALSSGTSLLAGQSGVGKSSLINALVPDRNARTQAISEASGQGRHTTTETTLYGLPDGGALIDSPGVRILRLAHLDRATLEGGFAEIAPLAEQCTFRDCEHEGEPGCAVRAAVERGEVAPHRLEGLRELLRFRRH